MQGEMFFSGWQPLVRTLVIAALAYPSMLVLVRLSGNRTLAKMNAFDFVATIALGSTLATVIVSEKVALAQGVLAFALLVGLQLLVSWSASRFNRWEAIINGEPIVLYRGGEFFRGAMRRARVTEDEVRSQARSQGIADLGQVSLVILETNGTMSIVRPSEQRSDPTDPRAA